MNKDKAFDPENNSINWLIGKGSKRGDLHNLKINGLYKLWCVCFQQKYKLLYADAVRNYVNSEVRRKTFGEFYVDGKGRRITTPLVKPSNGDKDKLVSQADELINPSNGAADDSIRLNQKQKTNFIKPLLNKYDSAKLAYGMIEYLLTCDPKSKNQASLYFFDLTIKEQDAWLPANEVTNDDFDSLYAMFQSEIIKPVEIDYEAALADCGIYVFDGMRKLGNQVDVSCPFHDDERPSLSINIEEKVWICQAGCGMGSLHILISRLKEMPWAELKSNYQLGVSKHIDKTPPENYVIERSTRREPLDKDHWIITERKFDRNQLINKWGVQQLAKGAGTGRTRDRTKATLSFPVTNKGEIVGYQYRNVDNDVKWYNSTGFKKSQHLFGIDQLTKEKKDYHGPTLMVVEGLLDVIPLNQAGFDAVAVMGSTISDTQLDLILGISEIREICLAFDADEAGVKALHKAAVLFHNNEDKFPERIKLISCIELLPHLEDWGAMGRTQIQHYAHARERKNIKSYLAEKGIIETSAEFDEGFSLEPWNDPKYDGFFGI